jgi:hypothetical protein
LRGTLYNILTAGKCSYIARVTRGSFPLGSILTLLVGLALFSLCSSFRMVFKVRSIYRPLLGDKVVYTYRITVSIVYLYFSSLPLVTLITRFLEQLYHSITNILIDDKRSHASAVHVVREFQTLSAADLGTDEIGFVTLHSGI